MNPRSVHAGPCSRSLATSKVTMNSSTDRIDRSCTQRSVAPGPPWNRSPPSAFDATAAPNTTSSTRRSACRRARDTIHRPATRNARLDQALTGWASTPWPMRSQSAPTCPKNGVIGDRSAARAAARVLERPSGHRDEPPVVAVGVQRELEDAEGVRVADLAVRFGAPERVVALAAGADDEVPDAVRVGPLVGILRGDPLVAVVVPVQHDIRTRLVERLPERFRPRAVAMPARGEAGMVPVGKRARRRMGGKIVPQPPLLGRALVAAADLIAVRVEGDDVPVADVEAVVALAAFARQGAEVREVAPRAGDVVVVVAERRAGDRLHPPPRSRVRPLERAQLPVLVLVVPGGKDRPRIAAHQQVGRRHLLARARARVVPRRTRDVPCRRDDRIGSLSRAARGSIAPTRLAPVVAGPSPQGVGPRPSLEEIDPGTAGYLIPPRPADQRIAPRPADQHVVPTTPQQDVVPAETADRVVPGRAAQDVVAPRPADRAARRRGGFDSERGVHLCRGPHRPAGSQDTGQESKREGGATTHRPHTGILLSGAYARSRRFSPASTNRTVASAPEPEPPTSSTTPSPHRSCSTVSPAETWTGSRRPASTAARIGETFPPEPITLSSSSIACTTSLGMSPRNLLGGVYDVVPNKVRLQAWLRYRRSRARVTPTYIRRRSSSSSAGSPIER